MSISNIITSNQLTIDSINCQNLYQGEERWVFDAPLQTVAANTSNGVVLTNWVVQPDSTGNPSFFNTTNGRFTVPKNGVFEINCYSNWNIGVSVGGYLRYAIESSTGLIADYQYNPMIGGEAAASFCFKKRFTIGQTFNVLVCNGSTAAELIPSNLTITFIRD